MLQPRVSYNHGRHALSVVCIPDSPIISVCRSICNHYLGSTLSIQLIGFSVYSLSAIAGNDGVLTCFVLHRAIGGPPRYLSTEECRVNEPWRASGPGKCLEIKSSG